MFPTIIRNYFGMFNGIGNDVFMRKACTSLNIIIEEASLKNSGKRDDYARERQRMKVCLYSVLHNMVDFF